MKFFNSRLPFVLLVAYLIEFVALSFHVYSRQVWIAENLPIVLIVGALVIFYMRGIRFSNAAYLMMSCLVFLHTIGGHYSFERVPFGWFNEMIGSERNMFDRVAHFTVGFFAYPILELTEQSKTITKRWLAGLFAVCVIATVAMSYEIIEWIYAVTSDPELGIAFLGSQGDVWDAQKDMLMDTLGALFAAAIYFLRNRKCF